MRLLVIGLLMTVALSVHAAAEGGDPTAQSVDLSAKLATWHGGEITVRDYVDWWRNLPEDDRTPLVTIEEKVEFLENMINARLMLAAVESLGIDQSPDLLLFKHKRRVGLLTETLLSEATEWRIHVSDEEIDESINQRRTQANITRIIVESSEEAVALIDSIEAGIPMEDLARRYSDCPTANKGGKMGPLRWGDLNDYWSQQVFSLEEGQLSRPFRVEGGYAIVRLDSRMEVSAKDPAAERKGIEANLRQRRAFEERAAYIDSLRAAYGYTVHNEAVYNLCAKYALALLEQGETREIVDTDISPRFGPGEEEVPLVTFDGWAFTGGDFANEILMMPYQARPSLDEPDKVFPLVVKQSTDSLLVAEAVKLGYDERPEIKMELEKVRRRKSTLVLFRYLTDGAEVPEDSLRAFYDTHRDHFTQQAGYRYYKMLLRSRSAADSVVALLEGGADFAKIAREHSIDPFTAPDGGYVSFQRVGADQEFDGFFELMDSAETRYFRSLEGHLILRLVQKYEASSSTFEEARHSIEQGLLPQYRDRMLMDWLEDQRKNRKVRVYTETLEEITLGA
jgi:peptidyl-prolyl cis-trans isomerase C